MGEKRSRKESDYLPKQGNPLQETVCYRLGGTVYEVHTSCGGMESLYDKMVRLIRSEAIAASAGKEDKPQYNKDSKHQLSRQHYRFIRPPVLRGCAGRREQQYCQSKENPFEVRN